MTIQYSTWIVNILKSPSLTDPKGVKAKTRPKVVAAPVNFALPRPGKIKDQQTKRQPLPSCGTVFSMKKWLKILLIGIVLIFAILGAAVTLVFFAMQYGLLNVRGSIMERNKFFGEIPTIQSTTTPGLAAIENGCADGRSQTQSCEWYETVQWIVVRDALIKDAAVIDRVSKETGVSSRMIAASVIPEQIRFFTDNREVFKRYFEPLKLLVSLSKFSLGVSGIKQETAAQIEMHAMSTSSPFYPGEQYAALITYPDGADHDSELFNRLTNEKDHYYSYLYTALYLKEIEMHWQRTGYNIAERPDVLVTLFNLGFDASQPKANPQVAGANITLGGKSYAFGYLGTLFYQSEELSDIFPR